MFNVQSRAYWAFEKKLPIFITEICKPCVYVGYKSDVKVCLETVYNSWLYRAESIVFL